MLEVFIGSCLLAISMWMGIDLLIEDAVEEALEKKDKAFSVRWRIDDPQ